MKYRKKPVVIEAVRWLGDPVGLETVMRFCPAVIGVGTTDDGVRFLKIHTLEGDMSASEGDWIIKGIKGEFYPCKPDIFLATYEAVF